MATKGKGTSEIKYRCAADEFICNRGTEGEGYRLKNVLQLTIRVYARIYK